MQRYIGFAAVVGVVSLLVWYAAVVTGAAPFYGEETPGPFE